MAVPEPRSVEDALLLEVHRELVRLHEYERAEVIVDLLALVAAGEELIAAVERGDSEAMSFHAGVALRSLGAACQPEFPVAGSFPTW